MKILLGGCGIALLSEASTVRRYKIFTQLCLLSIISIFFFKHTLETATTALHKEMQNGHFDVPDRLFSSIPRSFRHNTNQLSEVQTITISFYHCTINDDA